jgi:hypothetical protein
MQPTEAMRAWVKARSREHLEALVLSEDPMGLVSAAVDLNSARMTVRELAEELAGFPPDALVLVDMDDCRGLSVTGVTAGQESHVPGRPACVLGTWDPRETDTEPCLPMPNGWPRASPISVRDAKPLRCFR